MERSERHAPTRKKSHGPTPRPFRDAGKSQILCRLLFPSRSRGQSRLLFPLDSKGEKESFPLELHEDGLPFPLPLSSQGKLLFHEGFPNPP